MAPWELRVEDLRVFYDVATERNLVTVLAVGEKRGNRVFVAHEEIEL